MGERATAPNPYDRLVESTPPQPARTESMRDFVERWKRLGPILAQFEAEELKRTDVAATIRAFSGMVAIACRTSPPGPMSGLVEMQRLLARLR